jgi:hypothetical protein
MASFPKLLKKTKRGDLSTTSFCFKILSESETITYNFYATLLPLFLPIFSLNSDAIRFKSR